VSAFAPLNRVALLSSGVAPLETSLIVCIQEDWDVRTRMIACCAETSVTGWTVVVASSGSAMKEQKTSRFIAPSLLLR
jgi:hypothetical protein